MEFSSIEHFYSLLCGKKIIVFGTGEMSKLIMAQPIEVAYFVDNNHNKWEQYFYNRKINNPQKLSAEDRESIFIIVASMYIDEISQQLINMGFIENLHFIDGDIIRNFDYYIERQEIKKCFKNKHAGKRAFIIGNGPSLRTSDLDKLKNEICFASNKIYLAYDETDWRPTYYTVIDSKIAENNAECIAKLNGTKFIPYKLKQFFNEEIEDVTWLHFLNNKKKDDALQGMSTDIVKGVYGGYTVTYVMLQIAFYMGIKEIYLIGVDHNYIIPKSIDEVTIFGETLLVNEGERNHFHPNYHHESDKWTLPRLADQERAYQTAKQVYEKHGGKIYNASRKTNLDVFELLDFDHIGTDAKE